MTEPMSIHELLDRQHNQIVEAHKLTADAFLDVHSQLGAVSGALMTQGALNNISEFTGKERLSQWLQQINKFGKINGLSDKSICQLSWAKSKGTVSSLIGRKLEEDSGISWAQLKEVLKKEYGEIVDTQQAFAKLASIRQGRDEEMTAYVERMLQLVDQAYGADWKAEINAVIESQLVAIFMEGLRSMDLKLRIYRKNVVKIDEAIRLAKAEDLSRKRFPAAFPGPFPAARRIETPMEIDRMRRPVCGKCQGSHPTKDCRRQPARAGPAQMLPQRVRTVRNSEKVSRPKDSYEKELDKKYGRCFHCHQTGHYWVSCPSRLN